MTESAHPPALPAFGDEILLRISQATVRFGGLTAVNAVDLDVRRGELIGLIGPNGAGKTTFFNLITGVYEPDSGEATFDGRNLAGLRMHEIAALGIARTFQNIRLFGQLSAMDNVRVAANLRRSASAFQSLVRMRTFRDDEASIAGDAERLLDLFHLSKFRDHPAKSLPYGEQRRLEIVRALATRPKLLLLDEPAAGMNPAEKEDLIGLIRRIRREFNLTILLVEHSMPVVMGLCERIAVLDYGMKIAEGPPAAIRSNPKVIEAYLGETRES